MSREIDSLVKELRKQGWTCTKTKRSHWRLASPTGGLTFCPSTPSDHRSIANTRADVRRLGAAV